MKILYSWLQDYTDYKGSAEEAAKLLTEFSYEVEDMQSVANDVVLSIDVLANRAVDSLSHIGVARELAVVSGSSFTIPSVSLQEEGEEASATISVSIEEDLCPRYVSRVVRGISVGESPEWLKERLEALGQRSINNIVDVTNYVLLEYGQPLHVFDADKIEGATLRARRARDGEIITTLDEEEVELTSEMLVIADANDALAIAGIKGGKKAEIEGKTNTVVLESAAFDPVSIRRTSRAIGIQTESSRRFEAGVDLLRPLGAIDRAALLLTEVAGGIVAPGRVDAGQKEKQSEAITVRPEDVERLLGVAIEETRIIDILNQLQFSAKLDAGLIVVTPPATRQDVTTIPDVIEEIARVYGYNSIPSTPPLSHLVPLALRQDYEVERLVRQTLVGLGMFEIRTYSFVSEEENTAVCGEVSKVGIENALSNELSHLRASLLPGLLKVVSRNDKTREAFRLFETGAVFSEGGSDDLPQEKTHVAGVFVHTAGAGDLFYEAKGALESFFHSLGISDVRFDVPEENFYCAQKGRAASVYAGQIKLGLMGEINSRVKDVFGVDSSVVAFEIDLSVLVEEIEGEREYTPFSRFPVVLRDVAVVVPGDIKVSTILNVIESSGAQWIVDVDLFDMYDGEEIGESQKSLAFHVVYQSDEKTLTDDEVSKEHNKIIDFFKKEGWEIR